MLVPHFSSTATGSSILSSHSLQLPDNDAPSNGAAKQGTLLPEALGKANGVQARYEYQQTSAYQLSLGQQQGQTSLTYSHLSSFSYSSEYNSSQHTALSVAAPEAVEAVVQPSPMLEGAENILSFISQRIENEVANGATEDVIDELLQQGLAGFEQGYGEALAILDGSGDLNDTVNSAVTTLYDQVVSGIDELRQHYLGEKPVGEEPVSNDFVEVSPSQNSTPPASHHLFSEAREEQLSASFTQFMEQDASTLQTLLDSLDASYASVDYTRKDNFSFQLTTADGDKVTIQASSLSAFSGDYAVESGRVYQYAEINESESSSSRFSLSIEGDIDEGESIAIEHLLGQVMSLADEFYNGDIQSAYQAALELGYDRSEITGYSLNLQQVETYQVAQAYQQFGPATDRPSPEAIDIFERIGHYAQSVLETLNQPENYQNVNYLQLLEQIAWQVDAQVELNEEYGFYDAVSEITSNFV